ncbi:hypothetical protein G7061_09985 [Erysipelothrix sp. HDW6B]|uniref:hypothetical protein n=1 Tax=Erysipelothrix sp. HDW6B TaxID=2714929 RepID=UPI00140C992C|nr:hypothetical protein [Erysipelothrix sp. HDW6B]QIK86926.1 hypothetical protein G7061_09985 [Erysipelothrix sp. HDW6B]
MLKLMDIYKALHSAYGPQNWWPAKSREEMMLGAILVQNTSWTNVEKALSNFNNDFSFTSIDAMSLETLQTFIRPAGFYRAKSIAIKNLVDYFQHINFDFDDAHLEVLRKDLLALKGIGFETADAILLYAFNQPFFVVDTYLKRLFKHVHLPQFSTYHQYQDYVMAHLPHDVVLYQEFHALIVAYGKRKVSDPDPLEHFAKPIFQYNTDHIDHLCTIDQRFALVFNQYGFVSRPTINDPFDAIVSTIIGQLISVKAADSIYARYLDAYPSYQAVARDSIENLKQIGLTNNKAKAIHAIATKIKLKELNLAFLDTLDDADLISALVALPGIGDWSARMIALHGYGRMDMTSYADVALRRGLVTWYQLDSIDESQYNQLLSPYAPYRSIISIYLWKISKEISHKKQTP